MADSEMRFDRSEPSLSPLFALRYWMMGISSSAPDSNSAKASVATLRIEKPSRREVEAPLSDPPLTCCDGEIENGSHKLL